MGRTPRSLALWLPLLCATFFSPPSAALDSSVALNPGRRDATGDPNYTAPTPNGNLPLDQLPDARPKPQDRRFVSALVDEEIQRIAAKVQDPALRRIFENTYPNTLDTTVAWFNGDWNETDTTKAFPRSFIITGDIEASWLRDSTSQLSPYLPLLAKPPGNHTKYDSDWNKLYRLALGLVYQQSQFIIAYPWSNAFGPPADAPITHNKNSANNVSDPGADWMYPPPPGNGAGYYDPKPTAAQQQEPAEAGGVYTWESKFEVDSSANFLRLPWELYQNTGRKDFVNNKTWLTAVRLVVDNLRSQQRSTSEEYVDNMSDKTVVPPGIVSRSDSWVTRYGDLGGGVYKFERQARTPTETRGLSGFGEPAARTGLIKSAFRPSDDATIFAGFIPANAMAAVHLAHLAELLDGVQGQEDLAANAKSFANEIQQAIKDYGVQTRKSIGGITDGGEVYAYEVDGYGSVSYMDDANIPSLLSLPYLGFVKQNDPIYQRTRAYALSPKTNKWYFNGTEFEGIGGPHVGWNHAWPMAVITRALTTDDESEITHALTLLRATTAGTGLMHESINVYNQTDFTRPWFAWVNGLFGELVRKIDADHPNLLNQTYS